VWIINPDLLAAHIHESENLELISANLEAVRRIETWLDASIRTYRTVGVETVLSTGKYRRLVVEAKKLGFETRLIYVLLSSPDLNVERVRLRVAKGGHAVPEEKIRERYHRSLDQLPWFLRQVDRAYLFDNSGSAPRKVGEKSGSRIVLELNALPQFEVAARKAIVGGLD
jgi:predicted ABC-type ATPase